MQFHPFYPSTTTINTTAANGKRGYSNISKLDSPERQYHEVRAIQALSQIRNDPSPVDPDEVLQALSKDWSLEELCEIFGGSGRADDETSISSLSGMSTESLGGVESTRSSNDDHTESTPFTFNAVTSEEEVVAAEPVIKPLPPLPLSVTNEDSSFSLHDEADKDHINESHIIFRRDIWEGFVAQSDSDCDRDDVDDLEDFVSKGDGNAIPPKRLNSIKKSVAAIRRSKARSSRYAGTVGFRCRFCKSHPLSKRAKMWAVYPRTLKAIYRANIRFQRVHFKHCEFIPDDIRCHVESLKNTKGMSRGSKKFWIESALRKGLRDAVDGDGIVICSEILK